MKKRLLRPVFLCLAMFAGMNVFADINDIAKDEEDYFLIGTAQELQDFSAYVNEGNDQSKAKLTADIDMSGINFVPIGMFSDNKSNPANGVNFKGVFDGQGHIVSNLFVDVTEFDDQYEVGFFGRLYGCEVKNFGIVNADVRNSGTARGGILCGFARSGTNNISNVFAIGELSVISNIANVTFIGGTNGGTNLTNCYTTAEAFSANSAIYINSFVGVTEDQMADGSLCYQLNGNSSSDVSFYQTLGEDSYPVLDSTHGTVYAIGTFSCDGTANGSYSYSNNADEAGEIPPHEFLNGICVNCGGYEPAPLAEDGFYEISNAGQLMYFSSITNLSNSSVASLYKDVLNARLMEDIDLDGVNFLPISMYSDRSGGPANGINFRGTFDGQGHIISNLFVDVTENDDMYEVGLFGRIYGGTVKNLGIVNAEIRNSLTSRGGILCGFTRNGTSTVTNVFAVGLLSVSSKLATTSLTGESNGGTVLNNCFTTAPALSLSSVTMSNCYAEVSDEELVGGSLCYQLNGNSFVKPTWYQTLGDDEYPVLNPEHGLVYQTGENEYAYVNDDETFESFLENCSAYQGSLYDEEICSIELLDAYKAYFDGLSQSATLDEYIQGYKQADEVRIPLQNSIELYKTYDENAIKTLKYLNENKLHGELSTSLEYYLTTNAAPSEAYSNGTYPYIMEVRSLDNEQMEAEILFMQNLFDEAVSNDYGKGSEITKFMVNPAFSDGLNGWTIEYQGTKPAVSGNSEIMPVVEARNNTFTMQQTLTGLANGVYELQVNALFSAGNDIYNPLNTATFSMGDIASFVKTAKEGSISEQNAEDGVNCHLTGDGADLPYFFPDETKGYVPNSTTGCSYAFGAGRYVNHLVAIVTDGTLTISIQNPGTGISNDWTAFGNFRLFYQGETEDATESFDHTLSDMKALAENILAYEPDPYSDFGTYPNFSESIKTALKEACSSIETTVTGEEKIALIQTFSDLFRQVYECRQAYVAMMNQAESVNDMAGALVAVGKITTDEYNAITQGYPLKVAEAFADGSYTTQEAQDAVEKLKATEGLPAIKDGMMQIGTAKDLEIFSTLINGFDRSLSGALTADIDMSEVENFEPIGIYSDNDGIHNNSSNSFGGTFDGQGHIISNLTISTPYEAGFFGRCNKANIRNFGLVNVSITNTDNLRAGTVAGELIGCTVSNVFVAGTIQVATDFSQCNGFAGEGSSSTVFTNCYTMHDTFASIKTCTLKNCYNGASATTMAATGELCYKLNGNSSSDVVFYQTLGEDAYPVLNNTHGTVYIYGDLNCDMTTKDGNPLTYTNNADEQGTIAKHNYEDGVCQLCGSCEPATLAEDGFYEIGNAGNLIFFSEISNDQSSPYYKSDLNARLTADIDMAGYNFTPISMFSDNNGNSANSTNFKGTFDGQGHIISNLYIDVTDKDDKYEVGLFGRLYGATVKNLGIVNAEIKNSKTARGGILCGFARSGTNYITNVYAVGELSVTSNIKMSLTGGSNGGTNITNCYTTASAISVDGTTQMNCYAGVSQTEMADGSLCYKLNEEETENPVYRQTLGKDGYPVLSSSSKIVKKAEDGTYYNEKGEDAIENVQDKKPADNTIFDLSGRKVSRPTKGIYIQNGKKYLVK